MSQKKSIRGRKIFFRYKLIIKVLVFLFKKIPKTALYLFWSLSDFLPGYIGLGLRYCLAKRLAKTCGDNVYIAANVEIKKWENLCIGNNVSIHRCCYIDAVGGITIGNDVSIAHQSSIISFEHTWDNLSIPIRDNPLRFESVEIDDDVWIGCGCRILAGVKLASRTVIAAGAVVTKDVPGRVVFAGIPAKLIKSI